MISLSDANNLRTVKDQSFSSIGWLYFHIYEDLRMRGLVRTDGAGGYLISPDGARALEEFEGAGKS